MGKIITYKNELGGVFAQIELNDGTRILISLSTEDMSLKILKLWWGSIPVRTVYKTSLDEAVNTFLEPVNYGKQGIILDKIIEALIDSESVADLKNKIQRMKDGFSAER